MAYTLNLQSFKLIAENDIEALNILLSLNGQEMAYFCDYMGVTEDEIIVKDADGNKYVKKWAINYLTDVIDAELIHLGYVTKDTKALGIFGEYYDIQGVIANQIKAGEIDSNTIPIEIFTNKIITEGSVLKIRYLVNATTILQRFSQNS